MRTLRVRLTDGAFGNLRRGAPPEVSFAVVQRALEGAPLD
jgi:hypothetical protein